MPGSNAASRSGSSTRSAATKSKVSDAAPSATSASSTKQFNLDEAMVARPTWEQYKKGEIPKEKEFYKKYYNYSMPFMRDSYGGVQIARIKWHEKLGQLRSDEVQWKDQGLIPDDGVSECESDASMFKSMRLTRENFSKNIESPAVKSLEDKIGKLILTDKVQKACTHTPAKGSKYGFWGGGCASIAYKKHSVEDKWTFPEA